MARHYPPDRRMPVPYVEAEIVDDYEELMEQEFWMTQQRQQRNYPMTRPVGRPRLPARGQSRYDVPDGYYEERGGIDARDARVMAGRLRPGERISMRRYEGVEVRHHVSAGGQAIKVVIVLLIGLLVFRGCDSIDNPNGAVQQWGAKYATP